MKDVWFVGDHLMRDAYPSLQNLKAAFIHGEKCYLQETYDSFGYFPVFTEKNTLSMIRNATVEGLNAHLKLPNAIVILMGNQIITEDPLFLPSELEKKLRWILREIMAAIATRKSMLLPKNFTFGEPRIIWIKNFQTHVGDPVDPECLTKYNNLLKRICAPKAVYTPDLDLFVNTAARLYDHHNRINDRSFKELWMAISATMKEIDDWDEQYFITRKVEERLNELKFDADLKFERKATTYLAITGSKSFSEAAQNSTRSPIPKNAMIPQHNIQSRYEPSSRYGNKAYPNDSDYCRTKVSQRHDSNSSRRRYDGYSSHSHSRHYSR